MLSPIRKVYLILLKKTFSSNSTYKRRLILYRLDKENIYLRDTKNLSGISVGVHQDQIDASSIKFYHYLETAGNSDLVKMKSLPLYSLYKRQVKLKLSEILKCAHRLNNFIETNNRCVEVVTDRQTASIMKLAFSFLNYNTMNIHWKEKSSLTFCVTLNSIMMRIAALLKMCFTPSTLPSDYFIRRVDPNLPTVLVALPRRRPEDFFSTYVKDLEGCFNIIMYAHGSFKSTPKDYEVVKIKRKKGFLRGSFGIRGLCFNSDSYLNDILLIFKYHFNLGISIDVVDSLYSNEIDVLINRQQTNVIDNYLAIEARRRGIFILGDIFEEIFFCDSAICSSESQNNESVKLALTNGADITYRGSNSLIKYRMKSFENFQTNYLRNILQVPEDKKLIFYASDPSKEESQRYLIEKFLMNYFSKIEEYILIIKTHTQDNGKITHYSYVDAESPENVILIGDETQKGKIVSKDFRLFEGFDFNAAVSSSDGFLTSSSSSILQALVLGVKTGIVDKFNNGYYDYLINYEATNLVNDELSLKLFLDNDQKIIKEEVLTYCGLHSENNNFDLSTHLLSSLDEFNLRKEHNNSHSDLGII